MEIVKDTTEIFATVFDQRARGKRVGLVPTMGALHDGHLSLVDAAKSRCDFVVVTIFVNPTQFAAGEDLERYPRPLDRDLSLLNEREVDLVFCPTMSAMYPPGFSTYVQPPDVAKLLEGRFRATHFRGVTTIVLKLFQLIPADHAFFGQKDYQQCLVIQKMVEDFNLPVEIVVCPIVRESDGLAMSSRNVYLSGEDRQRALALNQTLVRLADWIRESGPESLDRLSNRLEQQSASLAQAVDHLDYLEVLDAESLRPLDGGSRRAVALVAANVGPTRLIDNRLIELSACDVPTG